MARTVGFVRAMAIVIPGFEESAGHICCRVALAGAISQVYLTQKRWVYHVSESDEILLTKGLNLLGCKKDSRNLMIDIEARAVKKAFRRKGVWLSVLRLAKALERKKELESDEILDCLEGLPLAFSYPKDDVTIARAAEVETLMP